MKFACVSLDHLSGEANASLGGKPAGLFPPFISWVLLRQPVHGIEYLSVQIQCVLGSHDWCSCLLALSLWASLWSLQFFFVSSGDSLFWHSKYQLWLEVWRILNAIIRKEHSGPFWSFSQDELLPFSGKWPSSLSVLTLQRTKASNAIYFCSIPVTSGPES